MYNNFKNEKIHWFFPRILVYNFYVSFNSKTVSVFMTGKTWDLLMNPLSRNNTWRINKSHWESCWSILVVMRMMRNPGGMWRKIRNFGKACTIITRGRLTGKIWSISGSWPSTTTTCANYAVYYTTLLVLGWGVL